MRITPFTAIALAALVSSLMANPAAAQSLKSAAKAVNAELANVVITAKLPLKFKAKYHVTAQGDPWGEDRKQGRKTGLARAGEMAFAAGDSVKQLWVSPKSGSQILVRTFCCGNKRRGLFSTTQHADFIVHLDPPINPEQLTSELIASALSGFFEFEGYGSQGAREAIQSLNSELQSNAQSTALDAAAIVPGNPVPSTVINAGVSTVPDAVRRGDSIDLLLSYAVRAPDQTSVAVKETRSLYFNDVMLPGYPHVAQQERVAGEFSSRLPQVIPTAAIAGTYDYVGEVCVSGDCISRRTTFRVLD